MVLLLLAVWPVAVRAAARVIAPDGWLSSHQAAPEAKRRAGEWERALELPLTQVLSSPFEDRYAETIAVFESSKPVPAIAFDSEAAAFDLLAEAVSGVVGQEPATTMALRTTDAGKSVVWGRWVRDDISYDCVLAPSGDSTTLVLMAVRADALDDYRDTFERIVAGIDGVSEPMPHFSLWGWRLGTLIVWLSLALGLHALMLRYVDHEGDHASASTRSSAVLLGLVVLTSIATYVGLAGREQGIIHAGSTLTGLSVWVGVTGMVTAGFQFLLAKRLDRGVVQSAPSSGVYASGSYSSTFLSSAISRSAMRVDELVASELSSADLRRVDPNPPPSPEARAAGASNATAEAEAEAEADAE